MHQLIIPTPLRKFTGGLGVFESDAADVQGLIASLVSAHEGLKPHILDESGALRTFIRVYVGDEALVQRRNDVVERLAAVGDSPIRQVSDLAST
ncbi:MAG: hypothetical protein ACPGGB_10440, partial [Flavobacteriales bacterium]